MGAVARPPPTRQTQREGNKMVKNKRIEGLENTPTSEDIALMRKELAELKAQVKLQKSDPFEDIRKASIKGQTSADQITIKHFTDHKKVALYHTNGFHIGKKIGPLHPGLLQQTFDAFRAKGIILSTTCPSDAEIAAYKSSDEYKAIDKHQHELKPVRHRGETKSDVARLVDLMAKREGIDPSQVVSIKPQEQMSVR